MKKTISHTDFLNAINELKNIPFEEKKETLIEEYYNMKVEADIEARGDVENIFLQALEKDIKSLDEVPTPLTAEESNAFDYKYIETMRGIKEVKGKLSIAQDIVDKRIKEDEGGFTMDLKGRSRIKKACKKVFGLNKSFITYDDYLKAREIRDSFDKSESDSMFESE